MKLLLLIVFITSSFSCSAPELFEASLEDLFKEPIQINSQDKSPIKADLKLISSPSSWKVLHHSKVHTQESSFDMEMISDLKLEIHVPQVRSDGGHEEEWTFKDLKMTGFMQLKLAGDERRLPLNQEYEQGIAGQKLAVNFDKQGRAEGLRRLKQLRDHIKASFADNKVRESALKFMTEERIFDTGNSLNRLPLQMAAGKKPGETWRVELLHFNRIRAQMIYEMAGWTQVASRRYAFIRYRQDGQSQPPAQIEGQTLLDEKTGDSFSQLKIEMKPAKIDLRLNFQKL